MPFAGQKRGAKEAGDGIQPSLLEGDPTRLARGHSTASQTRQTIARRLETLGSQCSPSVFRDIGQLRNGPLRLRKDEIWTSDGLGVDDHEPIEQ